MVRQLPEHTDDSEDIDMDNDNLNIVEDEGVPLRVDLKSLYDIKITKGTVGNIQIMLWDQVRGCRGVDCPLFDQCPYFHGDEKRNKAIRYKKRSKSLGKCRVEQKYLQNTLKPFYRLLRKVPDEFVMQVIGQHLLPLYHDLVLFLMEKAALKELVYVDAKGMKRVDPVFDQIDKIHGRIMRTWRESGLQAVAKKAGYFDASYQMIPVMDIVDDYEAMSLGVKNLKSVNPKSKREKTVKKTKKKLSKTETDRLFEDI